MRSNPKSQSRERIIRSEGLPNTFAVKMLMVLGLLVITATIYWPVYRFGFVEYDDSEYVYANPQLRQGFTAENIRYAFTTAPQAHWAPLVWMTFFFDREVYDLRPGPMHVENVVLHTLSGILLWILLTRATGATSRSYAVAVLFLCHPMHVESVSWITERKDVLSTVFLISTAIAYVGYCRSSPGKRRWVMYLLTLLLFATSLASKSMGVTFPGVLLLIDYWPLRRFTLNSIGDRSIWKCVAEKLPMLAIAIAAAVVSILAAANIGTTSMALSFLDRFDNAAVCVIIYISKLFVPINLAVFYQHPGSRPVAASLAAAGLLLMLTFFAWRQRRRAPYLLVGWLWFLGTLLPVIGLIQVGAQAMADRYSYLPSIGLFIACVWGGADLIQALTNRSIVAVVFMSGIVAVLATVARVQVGYWQNTETLFRHAVAVTDRNWVAHLGLGNLAFDRRDLRTALDEYTKAENDQPGNAKVLYGLGQCWAGSDLNLAIRYFEQAVAAQPREVNYRINLAGSLTRRDAAGDLSTAADQLRVALQIDPKNAAAEAGLVDIQHRQTIKNAS